MKLTREKLNRMINADASVSAAINSASSGGGSSSSVQYANEAGHAETADEATHAASAANLDNDSPVWNRFLRKDVADTAAEVITFAKGLVSTLVSKFKAGIKIGANDQFEIAANGDAMLHDVQVRSINVNGNATVDGALNITGATTGTTADFTDVTMNNLGTSGDRVATIWASDINAENIETETLTVTKEAHFFKLVVDELLSNKGAIIISSANCIAEDVGDEQEGWHVFFSTTDREGNPVSNPWRMGDFALCLTFNAEGAGTFNDVKNRYYWREVIDVQSNVTVSGVQYHRITLSNQRGHYSGTTVPAAGDNIVQLGYMNSDAPSRQSAIIISAYPTMDTELTPPSLAFYEHIDDFDLGAYKTTYADANGAQFVGNFRIINNGTTQDIKNYISDAAQTWAIEDLGISIQSMLDYTTVLDITAQAWKYVDKVGSAYIPATRDVSMFWRLRYVDGTKSQGTNYSTWHEIANGSGTGTYDSATGTYAYNLTIAANPNSTYINYWANVTGMDIELRDNSQNVLATLSIPLTMQQGGQFNFNAELGTLNSRMVSVEGTTATHTSEIAQNASNLSLEVAVRTNTTGAGENFLQATDFFSIPDVADYWTKISLPTTSTINDRIYISTDRYQGQYLMEMDMAELQQDVDHMLKLQQVVTGSSELEELPANTKLCLSMYVRRKSIGSYVRFGMDILGDTRAVIDSMGYNAPALTNVSGVTIVNPADATANTRHYAQCYINTTDWVRLYIVFHFTTGTLYETITCGLYCYRASSIAWQDAPVVLVGLPKLEIGDHPTAWTQEKDMLRRTGVYIEDGTIQLRANKVTFANSAGTVDDKISIDPTTGTLITFDAILRGNLFLPYTHITQSNWSDYGTYDSSTGTTYNLLGEIAGKSNAGLNLCVEYIQTIPGTVNTAQVRLPDLTNTNPDRWVGCEVNILNSMDEDLYVRGTLNTGNGFFGLRSWQGTGWNTSDHNVIINPGKEGKFKLIKTMTGTPQYFWICCYANLNQ